MSACAQGRLEGSRVDLGPETRGSLGHPTPELPGAMERTTTGKRDSQHRESLPLLQLGVSRGRLLWGHTEPSPHPTPRPGAVSEGWELSSWRRLWNPTVGTDAHLLPAACLAAERPLSMSSSARFSSSAFSSVFHSINPSAFRKQRKVPSALTEVRRV